MDLTLIYFLLSSITLLPLTIQDIKTGKVDARPSSFMTGAIFIMAIINNLAWVYILVILFIVFVLPTFKDKLNGLIGAGDITILTWVIPGLAVLNFWLVPIFLFSIALIGGIYSLFIKNKVRFVIFIFIANMICFASYLLYLMFFI